MSSSSGRLLILAPHATRTGSTRVLLHLLRAGHQNLEVDYAIELATGGPLAEEVCLLGPPLAVGEHPCAVLANSCLSAARLAPWIGRVPTAIYLHESRDVLAVLPPDAKLGLVGADRVLCVSEAVRRAAIELGVDPSRTVVLPPTIVHAESPPTAATVAARSALEAMPGERIVMACGEAGRRKGADLFVEMANLLAHDHSLRFAWVGRRIRPFGQQLDFDVCAEVRSRMVWLGEVDDPLPYLAVADVLVLASRSDPQPLVPVEAAAVGTPTVGFAIDGLAELGSAGVALTVPFPDVPALAKATTDLIDAPGRCAQLAQALLDRSEALQGPGAVFPLWNRELRSLAGPPT